MATQRLVNTNFWKDTYVIDLDPVQKLLFLYFLTNPRTTLAGVYEISLREVAFDTGIDRDMVEKIVAKFCADGKMHYERGWLILRNFVKHQRLNPSIEKGIARAVAELPKWLQDLVQEHSVIFNQQVLDLSDSYQSDTDSPQSEPTKPNLTKPNLKEKKYMYSASPNATASTKTVQSEKSDQVTKLYYEAMRSLGLPVLNHDTLHKKIAEMKTEATEQELVDYLVFMRDQFSSISIPYKPHISSALDIYAKRVQIKNAFERAIKDKQNKASARIR